MRVSIVLAICFLGVASASNVFEDFQNKTQEAFQNLEHFGQDFQQKLQDALKNLFGNKNETVKVVAKRDLPGDALQLLNDLDNPAKFAQDLVKVLAEMALQGRRKRDVAEDLKKITEAGKEKTQEAIQKIMDLFNSFKNGGAQNATSEATLTKRDLASESLALVNTLGDPAAFAQQLLKVIAEAAINGRRKRAVNPLELVNDLGDPAKFAQDLLGVLADMALQGRRKRDLAEDLRKFADAGKQKAQDALKKIMELFSSFKHGAASDETSTEKTVSKRDVSEDLQKIAAAGKEKVEAALKQLQDLFEQVRGGFNHDESSKNVTKRDITETLKQFSQSAQEKTQAAFQHLKDAFSSLFKGMKKPTQEVEEEVSTEVSVSKRSLGDFQQKAHESMSGFRDAVTNFFNQFRKPHKPAPKVDEDTTESS